jgi:hypothetical protein
MKDCLLKLSLVVCSGRRNVVVKGNKLINILSGTVFTVICLQVLSSSSALALDPPTNLSVTQGEYPYVHVQCTGAPAPTNTIYTCVSRSTSPEGEFVRKACFIGYNWDCNWKDQCVKKERKYYYRVSSHQTTSAGEQVVFADETLIGWRDDSDVPMPDEWTCPPEYLSLEEVKSQVELECGDGLDCSAPQAHSLCVLEKLEDLQINGDVSAGDFQIVQHEADVKAAYCDGVASVDVEAIKTEAFEAGKNSIDVISIKDAAYSEGFEAGVASINTESLKQEGYEKGFQEGKESVVCEEDGDDDEGDNDDVKKIKICHMSGKNSENARTLEIPLSALAAHYGNGDTLGECPQSKPKKNSSKSNKKKQRNKKRGKKRSLKVK